jgi:hypothetical protein
VLPLVDGFDAVLLRSCASLLHKNVVSSAAPWRQCVCPVVHALCVSYSIAHSFGSYLVCCCLSALLRCIRWGRALRFSHKDAWCPPLLRGAVRDCSVRALASPSSSRLRDHILVLPLRGCFDAVLVCASLLHKNAWCPSLLRGAVRVPCPCVALCVSIP